jgi:uncharacterized protein YecE (DUF72 family)
MIRVGIGGWTFEPWRGTFYPKDLPHAEELSHASRKLTSIEINSTFYRAQSADSFKRWAKETPDDFVFSVKAPMRAVNQRELAGAGEAIDFFVNGGVLQLGSKLGPILWQLPAFKKFDAKDLGAFLARIPHEVKGLRFRHALEVQHASFAVPEFVDLVRKHGAAIVYVDSEKHTPIADLTSDFVYARLQRTVEDEPTGYSRADIAKWAQRSRTWENGEAPADLPRVGAEGAPVKSRDAYIYMISGAKVRAPAGAMALIGELAKK